MLNNKSILITGGNGSFGKKFIKTVLNRYNPEKVIVYSRDELKQFEMRDVFPTNEYPIKYFIRMDQIITQVSLVGIKIRF